MKRVEHFKRRARARTAQGFTLIELMIAITILAVVAILSWRGLDQIIRGREAIANVMSNERVLAQTFDQLGSDARAASTDDDAGGAAIVVGDGMLQIVRRLYAPGRAPRLQVVRYVLDARQLFRLASPPVASVAELREALQASGQGNTSGWSRVALIHGVSAMRSRAWLDNQGFTGNMAEVGEASRLALLRLANPLSHEAPLFRTVTGLEVDIVIGANAPPFSRLYPVGQ
ncbi:MAG: PulJ/GspJ family protein [Janthinobacterium lividum]